MKTWSRAWVSSTKARKQRKYAGNAPLHVRKGFVRAPLSAELRKRYNKRNMQVRKGDEVKVMRGGMKGKTGTVDRVSLSTGKIYVDEIKVKKVDGSEVQKPLVASKIRITKLKLDDKMRQAILERSAKEDKAEKPAAPAKPETKSEAAKENAK